MRSARDEAEDFQYIIDLIYERSRIRLHDGKQALIKARLGKRMRARGIATLADYCDYLRTEADEEEMTHLVDALATNFTGFLREREHFEFLVKQALPQMLGAGGGKARGFQLWSAACSTGEEPYSMALYLAEHYPVARGWDWRILATDISTKALATASGGVYSEGRLEAVPSEWVRRYFQRGQRDWAGYVRVKDQLRERVRWEQMNLLEGGRVGGPFEVIFCRNVMIYFDRRTQQELVKRLISHLVPGGYLLTGHSESLNGLGLDLQCLRPSVYRKN